MKKMLWHPLDAKNPAKAISAKPLMPGDVWQPGDLFAASDKTWKRIPNGLVDKVVQSNFGLTAGRPVKE